MGLHYYIIDLETTGLKIAFHEVTECSIIRVADRNQMSHFIRAEFPWRASEEALRVTGRTKKDLEKGLSKEQAVEKIHSWLTSDGSSPEERCMIAHNANFDMRFSRDLWKQVGRTFPANLWLDTKALAKEYATLQLGLIKPKLTLQACLDFTGIKATGQAHTAVADTQNTYKLHHHLVKSGIDVLPYIKRSVEEE